jgi:hypothetical protein
MSSHIFFVFADALSLVPSFGYYLFTPQSTGTATVYILTTKLQ